jgi:hypothetical protein
LPGLTRQSIPRGRGYHRRYGMDARIKSGHDDNSEAHMLPPDPWLPRLPHPAKNALARA